MRHLLLPCLIVLLCACGPAPSGDQAAPATPVAAKPAPPALKPTRDGHFSAAITAEDFAAHVQRLASDEFEGRKPGTIGERMTTAYLIDQFQRMGLKPGNGTSFLQRVPMVETTLLERDAITLDVAEGGGVEKFAYRADAIVATLQGKAEVELKDSDVVFAGYGVSAPEVPWNDFAGLDVKGKTVIVLINDPGFGNHDESLFRGKTMTHFGRWTYKFEECARQGAAACLIVHDTAGAA